MPERCAEFARADAEGRYIVMRDAEQEGVDRLRELAEADNCIFVGRCAEYILRAKERMASVFISADAADRMERVSRDRGISRDEARKVILNNDKRRASFHNFYSEKRWGEAPTYDLCINSSRLGLEATRELIEGYIRQRFLV